MIPRDMKPITEHHLRIPHEKISVDGGIEDFTLQDFRHTCINNWRKEHHDYFKIMAASGHKTISVFKRYNLVDEDELRTLVDVRENRNIAGSSSLSAEQG